VSDVVGDGKTGGMEPAPLTNQRLVHQQGAVTGARSTGASGIRARLLWQRV